MALGGTTNNCPCCGQHLPLLADLRWCVDSRALTGYGSAVILSPLRSKIFNVLWRSWRTGRIISRSEMTDIVYADDPNGGPESENIISVQMGVLRKDIERFGLTVRGRIGYTLAYVERAAA